MKRKTEIILDDIEEAIDLLSIEGYDNISSLLRESAGKIREINYLEKELESAILELHRCKDIISSNEINLK